MVMPDRHTKCIYEKSPAEARLKRKEAIISDDLSGAENETRTRDPNLGKVVLYQLSYFRNFCRRTFPFFSIGIAKIWIISLSPKFFHRQRHKQRYNHDRLRLSTIILCIIGNRALVFTHFMR